MQQIGRCEYESGLRTFTQALHLCDSYPKIFFKLSTPSTPSSATFMPARSIPLSSVSFTWNIGRHSYRALALSNLGWTNRLFGRYEEARRLLSEALGELDAARSRLRREELRKGSGVDVGEGDNDDDGRELEPTIRQGEHQPQMKAKGERGVNRWIYIWGELAITYQFMGGLEEAQEAWENMVEIARAIVKERAGTEESEGVMDSKPLCRAVGYLGYVNTLLAVGGFERLTTVSAQADPAGLRGEARGGNGKGIASRMKHVMQE